MSERKLKRGNDIMQDLIDCLLPSQINEIGLQIDNELWPDEATGMSVSVSFGGKGGINAVVTIDGVSDSISLCNADIGTIGEKQGAFNKLLKVAGCDNLTHVRSIQVTAQDDYPATVNIVKFIPVKAEELK